MASDLQGWKLENVMNLLLLLLLLLVVISLPTWPYSAGWGYYPSSGLGLLLLILLILMFTRRPV
jgi:MFS superfamily sulfate permease-like transporter